MIHKSNTYAAYGLQEVVCMHSCGISQEIDAVADIPDTDCSSPVCQAIVVLLLILLHDALLVFGGISLADNFFTLNLEGGLIVKKKSVRVVPSGGAASVGSGMLTRNSHQCLN